MNNLAGGYRDAGRPAEALPIHEEALRLMRLKLGPDHPDTLRVLATSGATICGRASSTRLRRSSRSRSPGGRRNSAPTTPMSSPP